VKIFPKEPSGRKKLVVNRSFESTSANSGYPDPIASKQEELTQQNARLKL
jgi:hypothetical protein